MKPYHKPLIAFGLFMIIQAMMSLVMFIVFALFTPEATQYILKGDVEALRSIIMGPTFMGVTLTASSLLSIMVVKWLGAMKFKEAFSFRNFNVNHFIIALVATVFGIFGTNLLSELMDLPNIIEAQLNGMSSNVWGVLAIAFFGPVAEEVLFREACLGYPLRRGVKPVKAILLSALLFGVMHLNPAQIPFAFIMGLILGFIYWRTGNIVFTCLLHIFNNGLSCLQIAVMGEEEAMKFKMVEQLGGPVISIILMLVCALVSIYVLALFKKHTEDKLPTYNEE